MSTSSRGRNRSFRGAAGPVSSRERSSSWSVSCAQPPGLLERRLPQLAQLLRLELVAAQVERRDDPVDDRDRRPQLVRRERDELGTGGERALESADVARPVEQDGRHRGERGQQLEARLVEVERRARAVADQVAEAVPVEEQRCGDPSAVAGRRLLLAGPLDERVLRGELVVLEEVGPREGETGAHLGADRSTSAVASCGPAATTRTSRWNARSSWESSATSSLLARFPASQTNQGGPEAALQARVVVRLEPAAVVDDRGAPPARHSPGRQNDDQNVSESSAPTAPTAIKIQPIVSRSTPLTVALTPHVRIAPAAMRMRLTPIPNVTS